MRVSQRNIGPTGDVSRLDAPPQRTIGRREFVKSVAAGLGLGAFAIVTIGAAPASAAEPYHCNRNVTYIRLINCWCNSPDYWCYYRKFCSICLMECGEWSEIDGCC
ncbi:hypothetical protein CELD12_02710 [Cellulomonas sp. NTE-D12]|nr:hypothetical protein CELD12_02710 [Cellulomonas sp. NTE-D12]